MAHHKSAIKKIRQDKVTTMRNKSYRTRIRSAIKAVRVEIQKQDYDKAMEAYRKMVPIIDRLSQRKIIHPNAASRLKSRLNRNVKALTANKS